MINIELNTRGYGGRRLSQKIRVHTSDPAAPVIELTLAGHVESFASVVPGNVRLRGPAGVPIKTTATITPNPKYPFTLVDGRTRGGQHIAYRITPLKSPKGSSFVVTIENTRDEPGRYSDTIYLIADNPEIPEIQINVFGDIQPTPASPSAE